MVGVGARVVLGAVRVARGGVWCCSGGAWVALGAARVGRWQVECLSTVRFAERDAPSGACMGHFVLLSGGGWPCRTASVPDRAEQGRAVSSGIGPGGRRFPT